MRTRLAAQIQTSTAVVMATILALFVSGIVAGAAGSALILGAANSAGTANTSLTTSTSGTALLVTQNGTGTALRGSASNGIAGFFTSANGSGVSGVVGNLNSYGVYAANDAGGTGSGAALRANGKLNYAIVASSTTKTPISIVGPLGQAPLAVNSSVKVTNLNADLLDGLNSSQLARSDQTQHYSCAANDMAPFDSTTAYQAGLVGIYLTSGNDYLSCAVHLPDGATVTGFAGDVYDNTANYQTYCVLYRGASNEEASELAATTASGVAAIPGFTTLVDATISNAVIDNATYAYTAACSLNGLANSSLQVAKVTVTYTGAP
jgi:hypothetical protein